jgi:hypothetical protein
VVPSHQGEVLRPGRRGWVVGVFLFHIDPAPGVDEWLWVVAGDLPTAYLVTDEAPDPASALEAYCNLMSDWAEAVRAGRDLADVFPVAAEATLEHAEMLANRVSFLRARVIPSFSVGGAADSTPEPVK